jgi:hypothetical protein
MSWLFSQALAEAFSEAASSAGLPSAPLSVMPTPHKFWRNDKTMEPSRLSQFGLMCAVLTEDLGAALLTWFREAFPARTSARPAEAPESTGSAAASGLSLQGSLARWDHNSSSWRTPQSSLLEGLDVFSETWPRWGSMRNGVCWGRLTPERPMSENESGFLVGTPTASMLQAGPRSEAFRKGRTPTPVELAKMWPTPKASTAGPDFAKMDRSATGLSLATAVAMFPSPAARDFRSGKGRTENGHTPQLPEVIGGQLNPDWVEWLMGWPIGWTDLRPLETARFQQWPHSHSEPSTAA